MASGCWMPYLVYGSSQISKDTRIELTCTSIILPPYRPMFSNLSPCNSFLLNFFDQLQSKQKQTNKLISFVYWLQHSFYAQVWVSGSQSQSLSSDMIQTWNHFNLSQILPCNTKRNRHPPISLKNLKTEIHTVSEFPTSRRFDQIPLGTSWTAGATDFVSIGSSRPGWSKVVQTWNDLNTVDSVSTESSDSPTFPIFF